MSQETVVEGTKLTIRRIFKAPVEKVYQAWTDPAMMAHWLSPNVRWKAPDIDVEPIPGGRHNITMNHSDGDKVQITGHYTEIVPNQRIAFTWIWPNTPVDSEPTLVTLEFRSVPDGTELTLIHDRQANLDAAESTSEGWSGCLDLLQSFLEGVPLIS